MLDFDDLVATALALLRRPGVAPWVLFKLDGGLDHILIDEAQDTNPEQWEIVAALAEEFFAGEGARGPIRTVFAVGDAKQSIYSFQRADPQAFLRMRHAFPAARQRRQAGLAGAAARHLVPLDRAGAAGGRCGLSPARGAATGSRSTAATFAISPPAPGRRAWSSCGRRSSPAPEDEPGDDELPVARKRVAEPYARLARAIAATIAEWLATGERLAARDRPLRPGDIMVLVRRRNAFVGELLRALKQRGVPVAGADRLVLTEQLAVQDLVALGRFLLLPEDDLTLAAVLKGPLFDIDEDALFDLCLWARQGEPVEPAAPARRIRARSCAGRPSGSRPGSPAPISSRPTSFMPKSSAPRAAGARCCAGSAPRRTTRSRNSSGWRSPMSASMCRRCRGFCAGSPPATPRSSAISPRASATRSAS